MRSVNALYGNGADRLLKQFVVLTRDTFKENLIGVFMGIAYGGDVEMAAREWLGCGKVYGYDTFDQGHPDQLSLDSNSYEARCMDEVYQKWGRDEISFDWQLGELSRLGLKNAHLVKGLVTPDSCKELDHINLAWLDMDLNASMKSGYLATFGKIVPGGFLTAHDVLPPGHIPGNYEMFYEDFFDPKQWEEVCHEPKSYFMAWRKRGRKPVLHIITTCFRLENLRTIAHHILLGTRYFDLHWHIIFDGEKVKVEALESYQDILELPFVEYCRQNQWPVTRSPTSSRGLTPSFIAANDVLGKIEHGLVWIHDDDNLVHPSFFKAIYNHSIAEPKTLGWIFAQQGKGWVRGSGRRNLKLGGIDVAQFVVDRKLIGTARFPLAYGADFLFINDLYQRNPGLIQFDSQVLAYHNWLRK